MAGVRTPDLPSASSLSAVVGNEDLGGGNIRTAQLAWATLVAALLASVAAVSRERLTAHRTYYVRTDGSDANAGLADDAAGAFLTIQKAVDVIAEQVDLAGFNVTIQVRDGTYAAPVLAEVPWVGDGTVTIQGNNATPGNVIVSATSADAVKAMGGAVLLVRDLEVRTTTSGMGLNAEAGGSISYQNMRFGACAESHICARDLGYIECTGSYAVAGNAVSHLAASRSGVIRFPAAVTVTLTGPPAFSGQFAVAERCGVLQAPGITFSGSATGKRFSAKTNGVIVTADAGASYFPGDAAGEVRSGGRYDDANEKHTIWLPASAMVPRTTNGPALVTTELATNDVMLRTLDYDQTTHEGAQFQIAMPKSWDKGPVTFVPYWTAASGTGGVVWGLSAVAVSDDDPLDVSFGSEQSSTDTLIATNDLHVGPESAGVTVAGAPVDGDLVIFQVRRIVSDGNDTLTADAKLIGIKLLYTVNAANDD
jgi:hypothetical protein